MKQVFLLVLSFQACLSSLGQSPEFGWVLACNNPPNTTDTKTVLASGMDGCFYLAGEFIDTASFGDHTLVAAGGTDICLVRFNGQGMTDWTLRIGAEDYDYIQRICTAPDGKIILSGYFYGSTVIGSDSYTSYGSQDIFIACFAENGDFLWSRRFGGPMADYVASAETDAEGNIAVSGYFYGDMAIGDTVLHASSSSDAFLARFSPSGDLTWAMAAGGTSSDQVRSLCCDPDGNIFFTASFYYNFTIAGTTVSTDNPVGVAIAGISPEGGLIRVFQLEGTYLTPEIYIKADHSGGFYLSGNFSEQIFFGDSVFTAGPFNQDVFTARYADNGELLWARHGASPASDQIVGIDVDPLDNIYITGHFLDAIRFGQLTIPYKLCCGSREIFIVNYTSDGKERWGKQITGPRASVQAMTMTGEGNLIASGMFADTLAFDQLDLSSSDGYHTFLTLVSTDIYTAIPGISPIKDQLMIFPNPSGEYISLNFPRESSQSSYRIFNPAGQMILSGDVSASTRIDISGIRPGYYIILVNGSSPDSTWRGKFIKN